MLTTPRVLLAVWWLAVACQAQPSHAVDDTATVLEGRVVDIAVLDNDFHDQGRPLTVTVIDTKDTLGTVELIGNTFRYTPPDDNNLGPGETMRDSFGYTVDDGFRGVDRARVTVTIRGVNDPPVAWGDAVTTTEKQALVVQPLQDDFDPDDTQGLLHISHLDTSSTIGQVSLEANNNVVYDPNGQFDFLAAGQTATDAFDYTIDDGFGGTDTATVSVTVTGVNDAPVAPDLEFVIVGNGAEQLNPILNATDVDDGDQDALAIVSVDDSQTIGKASVRLSHNAVTYNPNNKFKHLNAGEEALDAFDYTIQDPHGATATGTITLRIQGTANSAPGHGAGDGGAAVDPTPAIVIDPVIDVPQQDDPPIAVDDVASTLDNWLVDIFPLENDSGSDLTIVSVNTAGTVGTVTLANDTLTYTPNALEFAHLRYGETATDEFTYTIANDKGDTATATVRVTVQGQNDVPNVRDDFENTSEDAALLVHPLDNDTDPDQGDVLTIGSLDTSGTLGLVTQLGPNTIQYDPNGQFEYLSEGSLGKDWFRYDVSDGAGGHGQAWVNITIVGVNDAPVAVADGTFVTTEDQALQIFPLVNDFDVDVGDVLTISRVMVPSKYSNSSILRVDNAGSSVWLEPQGHWDHLSRNTLYLWDFEYEVDDGHGGTDTATVTVQITGVNDAPTAVNDFVTTAENTPVAIAPLDNDWDVDDGDVLVVTMIHTNGAIGSISLEGNTLTYDPGNHFASLNFGETATDSFQYTIDDGMGGTDTATVTVTIQGRKEPTQTPTFMPSPVPPLTPAPVVAAASQVPLAFYPTPGPSPAPVTPAPTTPAPVVAAASQVPLAFHTTPDPSSPSPFTPQPSDTPTCIPVKKKKMMQRRKAPVQSSKKPSVYQSRVLGGTATPKPKRRKRSSKRKRNSKKQGGKKKRSGKKSGDNEPLGKKGPNSEGQPTPGKKDGKRHGAPILCPS